MVLAKNEFDFLVNSYYQAYGLSKGFIASGIFGKIELPPEIDKFRNNLKDTPVLYNAILQGDSKGQRGKTELSLLKLKLSEIFGLREWWFQEIEKSVNIYSMESNDMTSYRIVFQMASDAFYEIIESVIPHIKSSAGETDIITDLANTILNKNYWQGDETLNAVDSSRLFVTSLKFSDTWIYEYLKNLFRDILSDLKSRDKFVLTAIEKKEIQGKTYVFQYVNFKGGKATSCWYSFDD